jgi:uncharacterized protein
MKIKSTVLLSTFATACFLCILTGCFQAQPIRQYTLASDPPLQALPQKDVATVILIGPVKLAGYLDQPRIVRRHNTTLIDAIPDRQWAGNLADMINDKLVTELGALLQPFPVFTYPGTTVFLQGKRVTLDVLRFEGTDDKNATIEVRWTIFNLKDKSILTTQSSLIRIPFAGDSYETLVTALSQGLTQISKEIALSLSPEENK